jgi:hypothetical protein
VTRIRMGRGIGLCLVALGCVSFQLRADSAHRGHEGHQIAEAQESSGETYAIPGASFHVLLRQGMSQKLDRGQAEAAVRTVVDAFTFMLQHRGDYPRFDESMQKDALQEVVIEPAVVNQEGKEFAFLVARTAEPGRVRLLISIASLNAQGLLGRPHELVPALAREFQWVASKADTGPRPRSLPAARDLARAPVRSDADIAGLSSDQRVRILRGLFETYLHTTDEHKSLEGQAYYEVGTTTLVPPAHADSTTKLYDIRVREALEKIARDPAFMEQTPKAVRSLLNGKIWNVAFVKIDQRDWATRTRVLPEDKAVRVGDPGRTIQPASILVNTYRTAQPDDPFYRETKGLPMGALSTDQLARVIALEIEHNIVEKSMRGHVAQDETTAPKQ